jgi:hypothetical protein
MEYSLSGSISMQNIALTSSTLDAASGVSSLTNENLLNAYGEHMCAEGFSWRARQLMFCTAKQFLHWWRTQDDTEGKHISIVADNEAAQWELRETYLRHACMDRDLRSIERAHLNHFLHYLSSLNPIQPACPIPRQ